MREATTSALSCARDNRAAMKGGPRWRQHENGSRDRPWPHWRPAACPASRYRTGRRHHVPEHGHDISLRRAVGIAENLRIFQKGIVRDHGIKPVLIDKMIIASIHLVRPRRTGGGGYGQCEIVILGQQMPRNRCFPAPDGEDSTSINPRRPILPAIISASIMPFPLSRAMRQSRSPASRCAFLYNLTLRLCSSSVLAKRSPPLPSETKYRFFVTAGLCGVYRFQTGIAYRCFRQPL